MEREKILTADLLDIVFDDRNKLYGAYELRSHYPDRIRKALLITFAITGAAMGTIALAGKSMAGKTGKVHDTIEVTSLADPKKEVVIPKQIEKTKSAVQPQTAKLTDLIKLVDNTKETMPPQEVIANSVIGTKNTDGPDDTGIDSGKPAEGGVEKGIVEKPNIDEDAIFPVVEVEAKFTGNWEKFLLRNLNANVPLDHNAPVGRYTVVIRFVVDKQGNVSDIEPMSNVGYGMEQEAVRVLKKADKWEPAIQGGYKVKAYRIQRITFEVNEEG